MPLVHGISRSYVACASPVEKPETLLRLFRHVGDMKQPAHIGGPRLLREGLNGDEAPELPLAHFNFGNFILQHPALENREARLLATGKHRLGYGLSHSRSSLCKCRLMSEEPGWLTGYIAVREYEPTGRSSPRPAYSRRQHQRCYCRGTGNSGRRGFGQPLDKNHGFTLCGGPEEKRNSPIEELGLWHPWLHTRRGCELCIENRRDSAQVKI